MFDAKSLLEMLAKGAAGAPQQPQPSASNPLEDLLRQFTQGGNQASGSPGPAGDIGDLLRNMLPGGSAPPSEPPAPRAAPANQSSGGGLGDLLNQIQQGSGGQKNIVDILGQVFGQATSGVKEGAQRIDDATGAGDQLRRMIEQMSGGKAPADLMEQLKQLIANNQLGAGAALGGLGALILGTKTGRGLAVGAAKLGALALISGLAYKAYQNYSEGKPVLGDGRSSAFAANPAPAPRGSGFETDAVSNETAALLIRAMLAAAAADGRIDQSEQQKVLGSLQQAGLGQEAEAFMQQELQNPATPADLAASVNSDHAAVQVFTAARIAIELDSREEQVFLSELARQLGIDPSLVAHIDAEARAAA